MKERILEAYEQDDGSVKFELRKDEELPYQDMSIERLYLHAEANRIFARGATTMGLLTTIGSTGVMALQYQTHEEQGTPYEPGLGLLGANAVGLGVLIAGLILRRKSKKMYDAFTQRVVSELSGREHEFYSTINQAFAEFRQQH